MYFLLNSDLPTILASEETAIIIITRSKVMMDVATLLRERSPSTVVEAADLTEIFLST
jgi:hypothetical protein